MPKTTQLLFGGKGGASKPNAASKLRKPGGDDDSPELLAHAVPEDVLIQIEDDNVDKWELVAAPPSTVPSENRRSGVPASQLAGSDYGAPQ